MSDAYYVVLAIVLVVAAVGGFLLVRRSGARSGSEVLDPPVTPIAKSQHASPPETVDRTDDVDVEPLPASEVDDPEAAAIAAAEAEGLDEEFEALVEAEVPTFRGRLGRARSVFSGYLTSILSRSEIDGDTWDELEEALIRADVGIGPATELLDAVRARVKDEGITTADGLLDAVKAEMKTRLAGDVDLTWADTAPTVWLFVGVNGVGKTTSIGKIGKRLADDGHSVVMAAGDTFRAAAAEQLEFWAKRSGAELVRGAEGGDPSSVVFDAIASGAAKGADVVLADTAGRLHTKTNLMEELAKVRRVAEKGEGTVTEVLLVIDATTGQNGLNQARQFTEATQVTGIVLTKMDGSAKGGIVFAIRSELGIPVKLVGLGETIDALVPFDPDEFVEALFVGD